MKRRIHSHLSTIQWPSVPLVPCYANLWPRLLSLVGRPAKLFSRDPKTTKSMHKDSLQKNKTDVYNIIQLEVVNISAQGPIKVMIDVLDKWIIMKMICC